MDGGYSKGGKKRVSIFGTGGGVGVTVDVSIASGSAADLA